MSTYATRPAEIPALPYSGSGLRVIRVSTCLLTHRVGLDVDAPQEYDRSVLEPADARALAAELLAAADYVEKRSDHG